MGSACILVLSFQILNGYTIKKPEEKIIRISTEEHFCAVGNWQERKKQWDAAKERQNNLIAQKCGVIGSVSLSSDYQ